MARLFANDVPTSKEPIKPGPLVKAMAFSCEGSIFATFKARSITGTMFC